MENDDNFLCKWELFNNNMAKIVLKQKRIIKNNRCSYTFRLQLEVCQTTDYNFSEPLLYWINI